MDNRWTNMEVHGRLMVSDFTNLHCEDSFSIDVPAEDIKPGFVIKGLPYYAHRIEVLATGPEWVQVKAGKNVLTLVPGQTADGPDYPLSYAYGQLFVRLNGEPLTAFAVYQAMDKADKDGRKPLFDKLVAMSDEGDIWASYFALRSLVSPPYMYKYHTPSELEDLDKKLEAALAQHPDFPAKDRFERSQTTLRDIMSTP